MPQLISDLIDYLGAWFRTASVWQMVGAGIVSGLVLCAFLALDWQVLKLAREAWRRRHPTTEPLDTAPSTKATTSLKKDIVLFLIGAVAGGVVIGVGAGLMISSKADELEAKNGQLIEQLSEANRGTKKAEDQSVVDNYTRAVAEAERDAAKAEVTGLKAALAKLDPDGDGLFNAIPEEQVDKCPTTTFGDSESKSVNTLGCSDQEAAKSCDDSAQMDRSKKEDEEQQWKFTNCSLADPNQAYGFICTARFDPKGTNQETWWPVFQACHANSASP